METDLGDEDDWLGDDEDRGGLNRAEFRRAFRAAGRMAASAAVVSVAAYRSRGKLRLALGSVAVLLALAAAWTGAFMGLLYVILRRVAALGAMR